jgi:hypothetical protein
MLVNFAVTYKGLSEGGLASKLVRFATNGMIFFRV